MKYLSNRLRPGREVPEWAYGEIVALEQRIAELEAHIAKKTVPIEWHEKLEAEIERLRPDAERYLTMRDGDCDLDCWKRFAFEPSPQGKDAIVDAAMEDE